ncbi:MFS transporter [Arthrobacter sp. NtRootA1]|uniref:MFS transporter n=1 Tax=Micrococcaceae TaxID=1268 RepID=UPI001CC7C7DC|nr:MFS transporter [Arthrobacter sp. NtRootA1]BCW06413.1 MFS transporter [Arthrobacter sp. NtRootA1]
MSSDAAANAGAGLRVRQNDTRAILGIGVGNSLEWFDTSLYGIFAVYFAPQFFNSKDSTSALLSALVVMAVGFVARPFGGFLFGWISDRVGRKLSMALTITLAAVGSLAIGISPTYGAIGAGASVILVVARLVQGLAHGGELPSAQTYVSEFAPKERRGLWSSLIYTSGTTGVLAGTILAAVLTASLGKDAMYDYGWRIPFIIAGLSGIFGLFMRLRMTEPEVFSASLVKARKPNILKGVWTHKRQALQVIGMTAGLTVMYNVWSSYAPAQAIASRGVDANHAFWAGVVANVIFIAALPLCGILSDRIGRKPVLLLGAISGAILMFPLNALIGNSAVMLGVAMSIALICIAMAASIVPAVYAELFPTHIRTTAVAIPYAICVAAFGGTAPYLQTYFSSIGNADIFYGYAVALQLISALVISRLPETKAQDLREAEPDNEKVSLNG